MSDRTDDEKSNGGSNLSRINSAKDAPKNNGSAARPGYDRTETGASEWQTDDGGEEKVRASWTMNSRAREACNVLLSRCQYSYADSRPF